MATKRWVGKAIKMTQVGTITITAYDVATTYKVGIPDTVNGKIISVLGQGGTTSTTAAALQALLAASQEPEFQELTWTVLANVITYTANTPGQPSTVAVAVAGGTGTIAGATVTANVSPNDAANIQNYSDNLLPANGDTLIFDEGNVDVLWNVDTLTAVTTLTIYRRIGYAGRIGLPDYNPAGYFEYRPTEFKTAGATLLYIETSQADSPGQFTFNTQGTIATVTIIGDGRPALGQEVVYWRGSVNTSNLNVEGSSCAVAVFLNSTANIATLTAQDSTVRCGTGVAFATAIIARNSEIELRSNLPATVKLTGAQQICWVRESATATSPLVQDGIMYWMSSGTLTTPTIGTGATIDFSRDNRARTITGNVTVNTGATWNDPASSAIPVTFVESNCDSTEWTRIQGPGRTVAVT